MLHNLLSNHSLDRNSEVLVVSSGSTDSTNRLVRGFCSKDNRVELIVQSKRLGKSSAINEILKRASNEIIFFVPADVLPSPLSLSHIMNEFNNKQVGIVCGQPIPINEEQNFLGYLGNLVWRMHNRTLKLLSESNIGTHATGELMAVRNGVVDQLPKDIVNDDAYMAIRAVSRGWIVQYCEAAKVYMRAPTNVLDYLRQRRRIIFGHHSLKRSTNHYPRTLETMIFYDPKRVLSVIRDELSFRPESLPSFVGAVFIEAIANILALFDALCSREHTVWSVAASTKDVTIQR